MPGGILLEFFICRLGHQRQRRAPHQRLRPIFGMGRRALPPRLPGRFRGSQAPLFRMGHEEHQQSQRAHTQEELSGRLGVLAEVHIAQRGEGAPEAGHLRQGQKETAR